MTPTSWLLFVMMAKGIAERAANQVTSYSKMKNGIEPATTGSTTDPTPVCMNATEIVESFKLQTKGEGMNSNSTGYNKYKLPYPRNNSVREQVWLQEVSEISELTSDFVLTIYMNEIWHDPRLDHTLLNPCGPNISLDHEVYDKLWTPNTCFINSKKAEIHLSPFRSIFLMIYTNGTVWVNYRVKLIGPCSMQLEYFPMDTQECYIVFESFNYNNEIVNMRWEEESITKLGEMKQPQFDLTDIQTKVVQELYPAGYWDEMHVTLTFKRRSGWYVWQCYIPTYMTVFISWISFYLGTKSIPARTMLGVNALLAMTFQFGAILRNLPRVSYVKAIDVWMLGGMLFIFCSLLELAIIGFLTRNNTPEPARSRLANQSSSKRYRAPTLPKANTIPMHTMHPPHPVGFRGSIGQNSLRSVRYSTIETRTTTCGEITCSWACMCLKCKWFTPEKIDKFSMVAFPTMFLIFNLCYWAIFYVFGQN